MLDLRRASVARSLPQLTRRIAKALRSPIRAPGYYPYLDERPAKQQALVSIVGSPTEATAGSGTTLTFQRTGVVATHMLVFIIRWVGTVTISTGVVSGETVNLNATTKASNDNTENCQFLTINSSGSGTKSITVTFSGATTQHGGTILELSGHEASGPLGTIVALTQAVNATQPTTSITPGFQNSMILACAMCTANPGAPLNSFTAVSGVVSNWEFEVASYLLDAGTTAKTVAWTTTNVTSWAISAIEIKISGASPIGGGGGANGTIVVSLVM